MYKSHAPADYKCPICAGITRPGSPDTMIVDTDFVYRDEQVSAIINTFFWGNNPGHVIIVPNEHHESLYGLPPELGHRIFDVAQKVARAMKTAYECDGITTRQNNEPAGDQHAFHFHFHVVPRYQNDEYNRLKPKNIRVAEPAERAEYARKLRAAIGSD